MGTSRSDPPALDDLRIPDAATDEEAAAVAAAIGTYLAEEQLGEGEDAAGSWSGRRWAFAGRLESLGMAATRVPDGVPERGWAAVDRADRF